MMQNKHRLTTILKRKKTKYMSLFIKIQYEWSHQPANIECCKATSYRCHDKIGSWIINMV